MTIAMNVEQEHGQHAVNLSLLKVGPIVQATLAAIITAIVLIATATTVTVVVSRSSYQPPIPADDRAVTYKTTPIPIHVLNNDVDPRKDNLTVGGVVKQPLFGKAEVVNNRFILYTPAKRFAGEVEFEYICRNSKEEATAKVFVTIENHPPEPYNFTISIKKNSVGNPLKIFEEEYPETKRLKIIDLDDDPMHIVNVTSAKNGVVSFDRDTLYYTPNKDFNGIDIITYTISDDNHTASATVEYVVYNSAPKANPDTFTINMNRVATLDVLANDEDENGDELTILDPLGYNRGRATVVNLGGKAVEYIPARGQVYIDSFEYTITDGQETSSTYAIVNVINIPPTAGEYAVEVKKNTVDNPLELKYDDEDIGATLYITITKPPQRGQYNLTFITKTDSFNFSNDIYDFDKNVYSLTYTPEYGIIYDDYLEYEVKDNIGDTAIGKITIKVTNTPPIAVDDIVDGQDSRQGPCQKNGVLDIDVLKNDYDPNGDSISIFSTDSNTKEGGSTRISGGRIRYFAPYGFVGVDEFTYIIQDTHNALSKPATVRVSVTNTPPVAVDDEFSCSKGFTCKFDVLLNDVDANGDTLSISNFTEPISGAQVSVVKILDSQQKLKDAIEYKALDVVYVDTMTYTNTDGEYEATANVVVNVYNEKPVPVDDVATLHWNGSIEINVVANDLDNNPGDVDKLLVAEITSNPQNGVVNAQAKSVIYTPHPGFIGVDTFTYKVKDEYDTSETSATVTINVTNTPPVAVDDDYSMHWGTTQVFDVIANDYDPDNDPIFVSSVLTTFSGSGNAVVENGRIKFTAPASKGPLSFKYRISDHSPTEGEATVTVNLQNTAPVAVDDSISRHWSVMKDGVTLNVMENDNDADNDPIVIKSLNTEGTSGSATIVDGNAGTVNYKLANPTFATQNFSDSFKYTITDSVEDATATVQVTVTNNNLPTASNIERQIHWRTQNTGTLVEVVGSLRDADGDDLTVTIQQAPTNGNAVVVQENGKQYIKYTQNAGYKGVDTVTYRVSDGLASATGTITFTVYNTIPTAKDFAFDLPYEYRDVGIEIDVIRESNDEDVEDRSFLSITAVGTPAKGLVTSGLANPIVYKSEEGWLGPASFTYTISDGLDTVTKTITINTLPEITGERSKRYTVHWSTQSTGTNFEVMKDIENQLGEQLKTTGVILKAPQNGNIVAITDYHAHYKQNENFLGSDTFELEYSNGEENFPVSVTVTVVNKVPTANPPVSTVHWRGSVQVDLLATASDADNQDTVTVSFVGTSTRATFTNPSNDKKTYIYKPNQNAQVGSDSIAVHFTDGIETISRNVQFNVINALPVPVKHTLERHWREHKDGFDINVLEDCSDPDDADSCSYVRFEALSPPSAGTLTSKGSGILNLKATTGSTFRNNKATFNYFVTDGIATASNQVEVTVTNKIPTGGADSFSFDYGTIHANNPELDVLANDNDGDVADRPHLTIKSVHPGTSGATLQIVANGKKIKYIPSSSFLGKDTFQYTITDGMDVSSLITVEVTVTSPMPTAVAHTRTMKWDAPRLSLDLKSGSTGRQVTFASRTSGTKGDITDVRTPPNGEITYLPFNTPSIYSATVDGRRQGVDTFQYTLRDQFGQEVTQQVSVTIHNKIPTCTGMTHTYAKSAANPMQTFSPLVNCVDEEPLKISAYELPPGSQSFIQKSADDQRITYRPRAGWSGTETIRFKAFDGQLESEWVNIEVTVTNAPPVCDNLVFTQPKGSTRVINVLTEAKCTDANGDALTVSLSSPDQTKGTVSINANNQITWTHKPRRSGTHTFTFLVSDGTASITRTVTITIPNRAPTGTNFEITYYKKKDATHTISPLTNNFNDLDTNDILAFKSVSGTCALGAVTVNGNDIQFKPTNGLAGECTLTVTVGDSDQDAELTVTRTMKLKIIERPPVANNDFFTTPQGQNILISVASVLSNDEDPDDGDEIEFVGLDLASCNKAGYCHKTPVLSQDKKTISWEADPRHCSTDKIDYTIRTKGTSQTAKATIHLSFTNCVCYSPIDVVFVLDGSGSISASNWNDLKAFSRDMADRFRIQSDLVHVGIVQYASTITTELAMSSSATSVRSRLNALSQLRGQTNTVGGLLRAENMLESRPSNRQNVAKVMVLVTDGVANYPSTCSTCTSTLGSQSLCLYPEKYPGKTCSHCSNTYKVPCSDPQRVADRFNDVGKKQKIVALGIGSGLTSNNNYGLNMIGTLDYAGKQRKVEWNQLNSIVAEIVDSACDQNN